MDEGFDPGVYGDPDGKFKVLKPVLPLARNLDGFDSSDDNLTLQLALMVCNLTNLMILTF